MVNKKRITRRALALAITVMMLLTATVPSVLAASVEDAATGTTGVVYESKTRSGDSVDNTDMKISSKSTKLSIYNIPEKLRTKSPDIQDNYPGYSETHGFQEPSTDKTPSYAFIPTTAGHTSAVAGYAGGAIYKVDINKLSNSTGVEGGGASHTSDAVFEKNAEAVVAAYIASEDGVSGPRRIAYDKWGNTWVGNITSKKVVVTRIEANPTAGANTSSGLFDIKKSGTDTAVRAYSIADGSGKNLDTYSDLAGCRLIVFDKEGNLWLGGSEATNSKYIREFSVTEKGDLTLLRTVDISKHVPTYGNGAYVATVDTAGDLYIVPNGNTRGVVKVMISQKTTPANPAVHDEKMVLGLLPLSDTSSTLPTYSISHDPYTGEVWASGNSSTMIYRMTADKVYAYDTTQAFAASGLQRSGIEADANYVYVGSYEQDRVMKFDKSLRDSDPDNFVKGVNTWNYADVGSFVSGARNSKASHGIFPIKEKKLLMIVDPTYMHVHKDKQFSDAMINYGQVKIVNNDPVSNNYGKVVGYVPMGVTPYVYGAFVTVSHPDGAEISGKTFFDKTGAFGPTYDWADPQSGREGFEYVVKYDGAGGEKHYPNNTNKIVAYAKAGVDGVMRFWLETENENEASNNLRLVEGNYKLVQTKELEKEMIVHASVAQGKHKQELINDEKSIKFSVYKDTPIRLDVGYTEPTVIVTKHVPEYDRKDKSTYTNKDITTYIEVFSPSGHPTKVEITDGSVSGITVPVTSISGRPGYYEGSYTEPHNTSSAKVIATVPDVAKKDKKANTDNSLFWIDKIAPTIVVPADGSTIDVSSIIIEDPIATDKYAQSTINADATFKDPSVVTKITVKDLSGKVVHTGTTWLSVFNDPSVGAGVYNIDIVAFDFATNKTEKSVKNVIIDDGRESDQIVVDIKYDINTWTNKDVTGTVTVKSFTDVKTVTVDGTPYVNVIPLGGDLYEVRNVVFTKNTKTLAAPDYSFKAQSTKGSYANNTSKVTWIDKINPTVSTTAVRDTTPLKDVSFTFADPAATDSYGKSEVNNSTIMYTLFNSIGANVGSGKDLAVLAAGQLPGKYYIEVDVLDNATNPGVDATSGSVERYGPFPETGGITPPVTPGGALKVIFSGGESALSKLVVGSTIQATFDRSFRGEPVTVVLTPEGGGAAITAPATSITATGACKITFTGATPGKSYTMKITVPGKTSDSFVVKITFA